MQQEIRFCRAADGVRIAYAISGNGPPLVKAANYLTHLEYDWNGPVWRHWLRGLAQHHTLIRYDERGCGLSDWDVSDFTMRGWVQDLEAVVNSLELERFPLLGISQGAAVAVTYAVRHPQKVSHLVAEAEGRIVPAHIVHGAIDGVEVHGAQFRRQVGAKRLVNLNGLVTHLFDEVRFPAPFQTVMHFALIRGPSSGRLIVINRMLRTRGH